MKRFGPHFALVVLLTLVVRVETPSHAADAPDRAEAATPDDALSPARDDLPSDELIRKTLKRSSSQKLRLMLIEQIETKQQAQFLADLVELSADADPSVREASAQAVFSFGWERMSGPMVRLLKRTTAPVYARELACRTLVKTGRRDVVEALLELLDEPEMRPAALDGLRDLTSRDFATAQQWRQWWALNRHRTPAEWASGKTDELEKRITQLEKDLSASRKRSLELEGRAADALILLLENRADKKDPSGLIAALDESFVKLRRYAASELGKLKAAEAVPKLSLLAENDVNPEVRIACASALGQIASPESVAVLGRLLGHANEEIAAASARALGRLKDPSVVNRLLVALLHRSPVVRAAAAEALGQIGSGAAVVPLIELLGSDPEPGVREAAARALGEIGDQRALTMLEAALEDKRPAVRAYAIEALGTLKAAQLAPKLYTLLENDENPSVREAAVVALGKVGGNPALPVLITVLNRRQEKLSELAASSIVAICRRDETLLEPTADKLVEVGHPDQGTKLYELLAQRLTEKKDDKRLISVRVKLADGYLAAKQWTKAAPLLEELTKTLPDDVGLAEKHARALTELRKHGEALQVYQHLAARKETGDYWDERLALLEAMLKDRKVVEVTKAVDELLRKEVKLPDDVRVKLTAVRGRAVEIAREEEKARAQEIRRLIGEMGSAGSESAASAREKLKARGEETWPYLVEALDGPDENTRRAAAELLRELTRQNFGYRPEATSAENAAAVQNWKKWVATKQPR